MLSLNHTGRICGLWVLCAASGIDRWLLIYSEDNVGGAS